MVEKGTATRAKIGRPAAGKTGTSENWENAWFVGYTPTLSTAVWMGHPNANKTMANVHGVPHVVGGSLPAMIWHDFMIEAVKDVEPLPFSVAAPLLPSRAEAEAKARVAAEKRLIEREGFDIPEGRTAEGLPPERPALGSRSQAQCEGSAAACPADDLHDGACGVGLRRRIRSAAGGRPFAASTVLLHHDDRAATGAAATAAAGSASGSYTGD